MASRVERRRAFQQALQSKDPYRLAAALELSPMAANSSSSKTSNGTYTPSSNESLVAHGAEWGPVLVAWMDACEAAQKGEAGACFEAQAAVHAAFNHLFGGCVGNWLVPALQATCRSTHRMAVLADAAKLRNDHARLQSAVTLLQESFSKTLNDRKEFKPNAPLGDDGSKKAGVLFIVNQLFSMYFRLNTLRLCKNLLRPVESRDLHNQGSMGDMVTFRYYVGRLNMFEDKYDVAEENLDYALLHCHRNAVANKKRILKYLVPVKLKRGRLPTKLLLTKYSLYEFIPLVEGIRTGDLRTFNDGLAKYQDMFIRRGTYLLLEKCKAICYRNLFKRAFLITERHQIPLDRVATSFKWLGMPIDLDEVECILSNLIFQGVIKGYISHSKRVLVLSKRGPFPIAAIQK